MQLDAGGLVPAHLDALLTARQAAGKPMPKLLYTIPTGAPDHAQEGWYHFEGASCTLSGLLASDSMQGQDPATSTARIAGGCVAA